MNFLNPGMIGFLAPLLALPLFIHLFNRRFPHAIRFPDLERIRKSLAERSKLMRWRHLLMTLLRTLAVLLGLLAFLKPVLPRFGSDGGEGEGGVRQVLLVVDRSYSLEHREGTRTSAARNALVEAGKILSTLGGRDRANAILAGAHPEPLLPEFTSTHDRVRTSLAALPPSFEHADIRKAIALAASLLGGKKSAGVEIYFLSDFQRSNWADADFTVFPEAARLFFVDTAGDGERENTALLSLEPSSTRVSVRDPIRLSIRAGNWTAEPVTLPVEAVIDGRNSVAGEIFLKPWSTGQTGLEFNAPGEEGFHSVVVQTPGDALPGDNRRYMTFEVGQREEVLVLTDEPADESGALFISTALDPFENQRGPFTPRQLPVAALTPGLAASTSKIVVTGIGALERAEAVRLVSHLENGGGLIYFLDGEHDGENLRLLDSVAARTAVPFHLAGRLTTDNFGGEPQRIARGEFRSRFLRLFRGENRQALALLEFYEVQRALPTGEGQIILSFADGSPAMGVSEIGLGTAVFCNFTPAELASNLARQRAFPAWVQELVRNLTPDAIPELTLETGSSITADLWQRDLSAHSILAPDGDAVSLRALPDGERVHVTFDAAKPGIYQLGPPRRPIWAHAVNISARESDLRAIDPAEMTGRAAAAPAGSGHFVLGAEDYEELTTGRAVFHWFLAALAALLLVEMFLWRSFQGARGSG